MTVDLLKGLRKVPRQGGRRCPKGTLIVLAILAIVYLFYQSQFNMNLMDGSVTIPKVCRTFIFGSRHAFQMVWLTFKTL
jgi:hypothetical protein